MNFNILTPEQKRIRKAEMLKEFHVLARKKKQSLIDIRTYLAAKYGYKNEKVVEQIIIRDRKQNVNKIKSST